VAKASSTAVATVEDCSMYGSSPGVLLESELMPSGYA
jgi:hypothetical protein